MLEEVINKRIIHTNTELRRSVLIWREGIHCGFCMSI